MPQKPKTSPYEQMAKKYIEGVSGLFDYIKYEMYVQRQSPEVEGAMWILMSLTNPDNRADLDALVHQSDLRLAHKLIDKLKQYDVDVKPYVNRPTMPSIAELRIAVMNAETEYNAGRLNRK